MIPAQVWVLMEREVKGGGRGRSFHFIGFFSQASTVRLRGKDRNGLEVGLRRGILLRMGPVGSAA